MEREFLGLSSKNGAWLTMKDEATDKQKDPVRSSGMQWSFSNKVSALPQFLSFKNTQEDNRSRNTILDPLASSGYMNISTKDAFDSNQKSFLGGLTQKNLSIGKQGGNKNGMTIYPMQYGSSDAQSPCVQETRIFSVSNNQSNQVNHVLQSNNLATTGLNMVNSVIKPQQPLGSKSSAICSSIVGSTDLRNGSKSNGTTTPTQLTIFYGGSVCVYDDISPEKVKSILLLAGNGSNPIQNKSVSTSKLQPEISTPSKKDGFSLSQTYPSSSPLPTPLSVTSHSGSQLGVGSSSNNELAIKRPIGPSTSPIIHLGSPIVAASIGSASIKRIQPGGLPQARKASLARFLEKRKERVVSTSPYYMCKKSSPECSNPAGSNSGSFSMDFSGSCP